MPAEQQHRDLKLEANLVRMGFPPTIQRDGRTWRRLKPQEVPSPGTPIRFINPGLKLNGSGRSVDPKPGDEDCLPHLVPWRGVIAGPIDAGQVGLAHLMGTWATGALPTEEEDMYFVHPFWLLYVPEAEIQ